MKTYPSSAKWSIRSYNAVLREFKRSGLTHSQAQKAYATLAGRLNRPAFGVDVKRHPRISKQAAQAATRPTRKTTRKTTTKPTRKPARKVEKKTEVSSLPLWQSKYPLWVEEYDMEPVEYEDTASYLESTK